MTLACTLINRNLLVCFILNLILLGFVKEYAKGQPKGREKNKPNKNADFSLPFRFSLCTLFPLPLPLSAFLHIERICFYYGYNFTLFQAFHLFPLICNFYIKLWGIRPHGTVLVFGLLCLFVFFLSLISDRKNLI